MRQLFKHCAHSVAMAAVLLALTTAETHAGRFLDDSDFEEAMSLQQTGPVTAAGPGLTQTVVSADPAATAGNGGDAGDSVNDPVEELNRLAHRLNQEVRRFVLEPVSDAYVEATSAPVRTGSPMSSRTCGSPSGWPGTSSRATGTLRKQRRRGSPSTPPPALAASTTRRRTMASIPARPPWTRSSVITASAPAPMSCCRCWVRRRSATRPGGC